MKKIILIFLLSFLISIGFNSVNAEEVPVATTTEENSPIDVTTTGEPITEVSATDEVNLDENVQASDLGVKEPNVLPGHPFYFIKNWGRDIRSMFTFDPIKKAKLESEFSNERLIELRKMAESNMNKKSLEKATDDYQKAIKKTEELTAKIKEKSSDNQKVKDFSKQIIQQSILHEKILSKLEKQVPEKVYNKIKEAREEHITKFGEILSNLENNSDIPESLSNTLDNMHGSDFKQVKNIELLNRLKEKLPQQVADKIETKIEERTDSLKNKLESLSPRQQEKFQNYIENISGDNQVHLDIIDRLKGKPLSDKLEKIIDATRKKSLQKMENVQGINLNEDKVKKEIAKNKDLLEKVKTLILEKGINKDTMPKAFQLVEDANVDFSNAKKSLKDGNYAKAFGEIKSSLSLSKSTENLIKRIAGFTDTNTGTNIICNSKISIPVCGTNGKTYSNICEANKDNIGIVYRGKCEEQKECAAINEKVNRNPLIGATDQICCEGLKEFRINKSYSICGKDDTEFKCKIDKNCPLSQCAGKESKCVDFKCVIPKCENEEACIQVISPAKSPNGQCKNFPSPCDIPKDWISVDACQPIRLEDTARQEKIKLERQSRIKAIESNTTNTQEKD